MACSPIDSFQYFGGSLAGVFLGALLDRSWGSYFYFMAPFGLIGGVLMLSILGKVTLAKQPRAVSTLSCDLRADRVVGRLCQTPI